MVSRAPVQPIVNRSAYRNWKGVKNSIAALRTSSNSQFLRSEPNPGLILASRGFLKAGITKRPGESMKLVHLHSR